MQLPRVACVYKDIYVKEHGQFGFAADKFRLCCVERASEAEAERSPLKCWVFFDVVHVVHLLRMHTFRLRHESVFPRRKHRG